MTHYSEFSIKLNYFYSSSQIIKILNLYTAGDEERISGTFIKKVQSFLIENRQNEGIIS